MLADTHSFVAWEEHIICHERGKRVVHFYLKDEPGDKVLAVLGTERSIRHMMYVVSDDFLRVYGSEGSINACTKWRARREVVEWLTALVSRRRPPLDHLNSQTDELAKSLGSLNFSKTGSSSQTNLPGQMVPRKLRVQSSDIVWSGVALICAKQLEHYPAFCRNGITITVHSFVFIMAEAESHYLGYLEDLYEDKKSQKKVRVRWFHHNQEVKSVISQLNPHSREVFITPHVQVISAECVDGPATVLTPNHYEKCLAVVPHTSSGVYMCFRQLKNNKVKPFSLTKLRGYSNQAILSCLNDPLVSKQKDKCRKLKGKDEEFLHEEPVRHSAKRNRSSREDQRLETPGVTNSTPGSQITKGEPTYPKLKFRLSKGPMGIKFVEPQPQLQLQPLLQPPCPLSLKVSDKIELLCQDSGIRGCWFRCRVLKTSPKNVKVRYDDVEDVEGPGKLEEWVPASRVAAPDKLGMRCSGRLTIRPRPPEDSRCQTFKVGAPVDAWGSDGWWEGVVTQVDISEKDSLQVYFPGEKMFKTIKKKDMRTSRDWVGNTWVDIEARPDIICNISATASLSGKTSMCSTMVGASKCGGSEPLDHKVHSASKLEAVEEGKRELCGKVSDNKCGGSDENVTFRRGKSILEEDFGSANQKI